MLYQSCISTEKQLSNETLPKTEYLKDDVVDITTTGEEKSCSLDEKRNEH